MKLLSLAFNIKGLGHTYSSSGIADSGGSQRVKRPSDELVSFLSGGGQSFMLLIDESPDLTPAKPASAIVEPQSRIFIQ